MKRLGYIFLSILLIQLTMPGQVYLHNKPIKPSIFSFSTYFNKVATPIKPLQQSNNLLLLGPNNENQPVVTYISQKLIIENTGLKNSKTAIP